MVMAEQWYAIRVEPGCEKSVAEALRTDQEQKENRTDLKAYLAVKGCEMVMPLATTDVIRMGRKFEVTRPAIPGYLFRRMVMTGEAYHAVREIAGVIGFLPRGTPLPITQAELDKLTKTCAEKFGESGEDQDLGWMVGKIFRLVAGPYQGFSGECIKIEKAPVLMVNCFGRLTPRETYLIEIDLQNFEDPVAEAEKRREERRKAKAERKKRHRRPKFLVA